MCENETTQRSNQKWCGRRLKMNKILTMVRQSRRLSSCSSTSETNVYDLNFQHRPGANNINGLVSWLAFDAQTASCGNLNTVRHVRNKFPGVQKTELQARELRKPALASSILFTNFYQCQFYNLPKSLSHDFPRSTGLPYFRWFVSLWAVTETLQQSGVMHAPFSRQRLSGVKGKHSNRENEQKILGSKHPLKSSGFAMLRPSFSRQTKVGHCSRRMPGKNLHFRRWGPKYVFSAEKHKKCLNASLKGWWKHV